jgi:hypothetical protein
MKRPRGYITWRPYKANQDRVQQIRQVLAAYSAHLPLTARQIFYALVGKGRMARTNVGGRDLSVEAAMMLAGLPTNGETVGNYSLRSAPAVEQLDLHPAPERFDHRVVVGRADCSHRRRQAGIA